MVYITTYNQQAVVRKIVFILDHHHLFRRGRVDDVMYADRIFKLMWLSSTNNILLGKTNWFTPYVWLASSGVCCGLICCGEICSSGTVVSRMELCDLTIGTSGAMSLFSEALYGLRDP